ncbi:MAG: hypothetical protein JXQ30_10330 [Spirochaetes bacterium]|nr:hypothetical protein [Spirochaetota bacterium]
MGILNRIFGTQKNKAKPYVDAGMALLYKLMVSFNLSGLKDGLPSYTRPEMEAIDRRLSSFQKMANDEMGGNARFHPEIVQDLQRTLAAEALLELAGNEWKFSDETPKDWKEYVATYLKAWAVGLNPMALLELGDFLARVGYRSEARETFQVVLLFTTYADTYYRGQRKAELVESIVESAKESLRDLG